jgi:hypothetical protein
MGQVLSTLDFVQQTILLVLAHCSQYRLEALLAKINNPNIMVCTTAAAALWGLATTGGCRRGLAELDAVPILLAAITKTTTMHVRRLCDVYVCVCGGWNMCL